MDNDGKQLSTVELDSKQMHQSLVKIIRNVHEDLRINYRKSGDEESVWTEHLQDDQRLKEYSRAMHKLATTVWTINNPSTRIDWCHRICTEYFTTNQLNTSSSKVMSFFVPNHEKLRLLDVGSCYGPFRRWDRYQTINIDIAPATENVLQCDFLQVKVSEDDTNDTEEKVHLLLSQLKSQVDTLPSCSFHVVVFSLVLEYLPCSRQRWLFCRKAHQLLMHHGLLLIITPDSKHIGYNSHMIKSWKEELCDIGFTRYRYEKQTHLHCMAFTKVHCDVDTTNCPSSCDRLFIPQDFTDYTLLHPQVEPFVERTLRENEVLRESFNELPYYSDDDIGT